MNQDPINNDNDASFIYYENFWIIIQIYLLIVCKQVNQSYFYILFYYYFKKFI